MTIYTVTTFNWNSPAFWSGITQGTSGHTLDFSSLTSAFTVMLDKPAGNITISDGAVTYIIGESGYIDPPTADATLGTGTDLDFFTQIIFPNGTNDHTGDISSETITGGDASDLIDGQGGGDSLEGGQGDDTLIGGEGDNVLSGGDGADSITAGSGGDRASGGSGNDTIMLGAGNDTIYGDDGNDSLFGESGNDTIFGGSGNDTVDGGADDDVLYGQDGADLLIGGAGDDDIEGGWDGSNDTVYGGAGNDDIYTASGDDSIFGGDGVDYISAGWGNDLAQGDAGNDIIVGYDGDDTLHGDAGDDVLSGGGGADADSLTGGDGADSLYGYAGDTIDGGEGGVDNDRLYVTNVDVITYGTAESGTISFTTGGSLTFSNIETVIQMVHDGIIQGTAFDDGIGHLYIDADGEWIDNNDASGFSGSTGHDDYVLAGAGNDSVWGLYGDDTIFGESGNDSLRGGEGSDSLLGGDDNDTLEGSYGNDTLIGGAGDDSMIGGSDNDSLLGEAGNDWLSGWGGADTLYGGDGDDTLYGGGGADSIFGGNGSDVINQNQIFGPDIIEGGEGGTDQDRLTFFESDTGVEVTLNTSEAGTVSQVGYADVSQFIEIENFTLSNFDDTLSGGANTAAMQIDAGTGDDAVTGGSAADAIDGQGGADTIYGGAGNDTIDGGDGNDDIRGYEDDDLLRGGDGSDDIFIREGDGIDTVEGGESASDNDRLILSENSGQGVTVTMTGDKAGTYSFDSTNGSGSFTEIEGVLLTNQDDHFDGSGITFATSAAGFDGDDSLVGGAGNDIFQGDRGADTFRSGLGNDSLSGGDDADLFIIEDNFGSDDIYGGEGVSTGEDRDMLDFSALSNAVTVLGSGILSESGIGFASGNTLNYREVESFTLTDHNDSFYGTSGDETVVGGEGNDYIEGGGGDDLLKAGNGQDTLLGGDGNDTLMNAAGDDSLVGGSGDDLIIATAGNDTLEGDAGNDTLMGGTDDDSLEGGADNDLLLGDLAGVEFNATGSDGVGLAAGISDFPTTQLSYELTFSSTASTSDVTVLASYAVAGSPDEFLVYLQDGVLVAGFDSTNYVNTGIDLTPQFDGDVHTVAVTWDSGTGAFEAYLDGVSIYSGTTGTGVVLEAGGTFALGQEQDAVGGSFDPAQNFEGTIYGLRLYDDVRTGAEINASALGPVADSSDPNLVANWVADPDAASFTDTTGNHAVVMSGDVQSSWSAGEDSLLGGSGDDTLYGGGGDDSLSGGDGADYLDGGTGSNYYETGLGADTIEDTDGTWGVASYIGSNAAVNIDLSDAATETGGWAEGDTLIGVEQIDGSFSFDDQITGDSTVRLIKGWGGDDTLNAGAGDTTIEGGTGIDSITGGLGNDLLLGETESDTIRGGGGNDTILGGEHNDRLSGESGDDSLVGGLGNDILTGDSGSDTLEGGDGADRFEIWGGDDSATVIGGEGGTDNDTLWLINSGDGYGVVFDGDETGDAILSDGTAVDFNEIEQIWGSTGDDTVDASAANASVTVVGNAGDDNITGSSAGDVLRGEAGADTIDGAQGNDSISGGNDNDSLSGGDGADTLSGQGGDDNLSGGAGDDSLIGGAGNDTFSYTPGDGLDTITDFNTGNSGSLSDGNSTNNDFIDLSSFYDDIFELHADFADDSILNQSNTTKLSGAAVDYSDNAQFASGEGIAFSGASADSSSFTNENTGVICFTADTMILTPSGEVAIQRLRPGDAVVTRDNGVQRLVWSAARRIGAQELARNADLRPISIAPELVGANARLLVSPQHGMVVKRGNGDETLVRARHLARIQGGKARVALGRREVVYIHLMFEAHQIIFANGAPSESFYPGPQALSALTPAPMRELKRIFPDLSSTALMHSYGQTARTFARFQELPDSERDLLDW